MLSEIRATHKPLMLQLFFVLVAIGIALLLLASYFGYMSYQASTKTIDDKAPLQEYISSQEISNNWKTKTAQTKFDIDGVLQPSYSVEVYCTINSPDFSQNQPSTINVSLSFPTTCWHDIDIRFIQVEPINAISGFPEWRTNTYSAIGFSKFSLYQVETIGANQDWNGSDGFGFPVLFQDSGLIKLRIEVFAVPSQSDYNMLSNSSINDLFLFNRLQNFNYDFNTTITIPIYIESSESVQLQESTENWQNSMLNQTIKLQDIENQNYLLQQKLENQQESSGYMNLALTVLVIALMLFDMAVIIFDHSIDEDRNAEYKKKQTNQKEQRNIPPIDYDTV